MENLVTVHDLRELVVDLGRRRRARHLAVLLQMDFLTEESIQTLLTAADMGTWATAFLLAVRSNPPATRPMYARGGCSSDVYVLPCGDDTILEMHFSWRDYRLGLMYRRDGELHRSDALPAVEVFYADQGLPMMTAHYEDGVLHREGHMPAVQTFDIEGRLRSQSFWERGVMLKVHGCHSTVPLAPRRALRKEGLVATKLTTVA